MLTSTFIGLPKKAGTQEVEEYKKISLSCHNNKLLLRTIMRRMRQKVKIETANDQFVDGKGTQYAIYALIKLTERETNRFNVEMRSYIKCQ